MRPAVRPKRAGWWPAGKAGRRWPRPSPPWSADDDAGQDLLEKAGVGLHLAEHEAEGPAVGPEEAQEQLPAARVELVIGEDGALAVDVERSLLVVRLTGRGRFGRKVGEGVSNLDRQLLLAVGGGEEGRGRAPRGVSPGGGEEQRETEAGVVGLLH